MSIIEKDKQIEKEQKRQEEINKEENIIKNNQQKEDLKKLSIL